MAADLHIHIFEGATEDDLAEFFSNTIDSKYFGFCLRRRSYEEIVQSHRKIGMTPHIWVGEVSWLKAGLLGDEERYVPGPVQAIADIIGEDLPVIDDVLIERIEAAMHEPNTTSYRLAAAQDVLEFLKEHKGKRCFTVSW